MKSPLITTLAQFSPVSVINNASSSAFNDTFDISKSNNITMMSMNSEGNAKSSHLKVTQDLISCYQDLISPSSSNSSKINSLKIIQQLA